MKLFSKIGQKMKAYIVAENSDQFTNGPSTIDRFIYGNLSDALLHMGNMQTVVEFEFIKPQELLGSINDLVNKNNLCSKKHFSVIWMAKYNRKPLSAKGDGIRAFIRVKPNTLFMDGVVNFGVKGLGCPVIWKNVSDAFENQPHDDVVMELEFVDNDEVVEALNQVTKGESWEEFNIRWLASYTKVLLS
jgi:hypothetical protein